MIVAFPHKPGAGGPGSFQERIQKVFVTHGWRVIYLSECRVQPDLVFIVGGTRRLGRLLRLKLQGVPILYRLDGILWMHRRRWPGLKKYVVDESRNLLMKMTHGFIADHIVYQSEFVRRWWEEAGWRHRSSVSVIQNGVDTKEFAPHGSQGSQSENVGSRKIVCVEGTIDYSPFAVKLLNVLSKQLLEKGMEVEVYGGFSSEGSRSNLASTVKYLGVVSRSEVSRAYSGGIYLSLDIHAACPNTVIEAMSCGLPVVGFDTGSLSELVPPSCGRVVEYGSDPWDLEFPDVDALVAGILEVSDRYSWFSSNAIVHAGNEFRIDLVADKYAKLIQSVAGEAVD